MKCPRCKSETIVETDEHKYKGKDQIEVKVRCSGEPCDWAAFAFLTLEDLIEEE